MLEQTIISQFSQKRIAVIGDVMLDRYVYGKVDRISPEAPIPIVAWNETMLVPGGAGNTAANVASLGAECVLFAVVGEDSVAGELKDTLNTFGIKTNGLIVDAHRPTTEKTRILGNHQQIVRIDHELSRPIESALTEQLCDTIRRQADSFDALLVCDYAKGVVSETLMDCLRDIARERHIPILADVRPEHKDFYRHLDYITPNRKETSGLAGESVRSLDDAQTIGLALARDLQTNILLTMSEEGMLVINHTTGEMTHLPTKAQEVTDVSGAGDTVIATMTLALACGADDTLAATIANHAASVVVAKLGTATLTQEELQKTFA
jgi:rfaE bifunctional protein kinase chain/domain